MTREVLITLSGIQNIDGESSEVELITSGDYFLKNGSHYILYEEVPEGMERVVKNTIKIRPQYMEIVKRGGMNAHMTFEKDRKDLSCYATPIGEMMIGMNTSNVVIEEEEDSLRVKVQYSLDINYQPVSECNIILNVHSKSTAAIHLTN